MTALDHLSADARQDLLFMYLAHHELESVHTAKFMSQIQMAAQHILQAWHAA